MNLNYFKEKEKKGKFFSHRNNHYQKNVFLLKENKNIQMNYPLSIQRDLTKERINKIKMKYSLSLNNINQKFVQNKIQSLKYKYMKDKPNKNNKIKIDNAIRYSISKAIDNQINYSRNNNINGMFRSSSLQFSRENNFNINSSNSTIKSERKKNIFENNVINNYSHYSKESNNKGNNNYITKSLYNFKYLRNLKEDFIKVHNKLKDLFQKDAFNKKKKKFKNMIFPISKKIYLLNEIKKDIKKVNKNNQRNITILPESKTSEILNTNQKRNLFNELFSEEYEDAKISEQVIKKPNLIRNLSKPKLNLPKYTNLYNMKI